MNYAYFSFLYDELMNEAPYEEWLNFFDQQKYRYNPDGKQLLDLACGTGTLSIKLFEKGLTVTGVDLSADMLSIASQKAMDKGYTIPFYQQNMAKLDGLSGFDFVVSFCDSINYLKSENEVKSTFQSVYKALVPGGLFLFDVHSPYKIEKIYKNNSFCYNGEDISYIWMCFPGEFPLSIEHELTFFVRDESTQMYERYDELHEQRTFPLATYKKWLEACGFEILSVTGDFTNQSVGDTTERMFFTVRK